jgi:hypothetical protein
MATNVLDTFATKVLLKDGAYVAVVADLKPKLLEDRKYGREALRFTLKIVEGASKGRLATVELLIQGSELQQARIDHDIDVLDQWRRALGIVDPPPTWPDLIEACRAAAVGRRVEFSLWQWKRNGNLELRLSNVKVLADV